MAYNVPYGSQGFCDPTLYVAASHTASTICSDTHPCSLATMPLVQAPPPPTISENGTHTDIDIGVYDFGHTVPQHSPTWHGRQYGHGAHQFTAGLPPPYNPGFQQGAYSLAPTPSFMPLPPANVPRTRYLDDLYYMQAPGPTGPYLGGSQGSASSSASYEGWNRNDDVAFGLLRYPPHVLTKSPAQSWQV